MSIYYTFLIIFVVISICCILLYNRGIKLRNYVREAFSTMDVYLKKRWDLIPNLIEIAMGYATHERTLFEKLTEMRTKNYDKMSSGEKLDINKQIGEIIPQIFAVAENYPDLKANQNFAMLMNSFNDVENDIANARKYYNGTVRELNTYVEIFPSNIICSIFGIKKEKLFEINERERESVQVKF